MDERLGGMERPEAIENMEEALEELTADTVRKQRPRCTWSGFSTMELVR
jgi:hypothetical protein